MSSYTPTRQKQRKQLCMLVIVLCICVILYSDSEHAGSDCQAGTPTRKQRVSPGTPRVRKRPERVCTPVRRVLQTSVVERSPAVFVSCMIHALCHK